VNDDGDGDAEEAAAAMAREGDDANATRRPERRAAAMTKSEAGPIEEAAPTAQMAI
jgi:hypothetical protein